MEQIQSNNHFQHRRCRCKMIRMIKKEEVPEQMPIQGVKYKIKANNSILKTSINITYLNDSKNKIEAILEMPTNPDIVISKMKIKIGDQEIEGKVQDKEEAKEKYDDAIAGGHQAGLMSIKEEDEEILQLTLGNILPNQAIDVKISFIQQAKIFEGSYLINIPLALMLLLTEHRANSTLEVNINCTAPITNIFCPKILLQDKKINPEETNKISLSLDPQQQLNEEEVTIYYKTYDNDKPQILAQRNAEEVALMIQIMPTFAPEPQEPSIDIQYEELPEDTDIPPKLQSKALVVFIVDRSGSMSGNKMNVTKEALLLFLKSLPVNDTLFEIISFGSEYHGLSSDSKAIKTLEYNQENLEMAVKKINAFSANMGGTSLLKPLQKALDLKVPKGYTKSIFMLTDGQTEDAHKCTKEIKNKSQDSVVHVFGIGSDCDKKWLEKVADDGEGICTLLLNNEVDKIRSKVIEVLSQSLQPSLKEVKTNFTSQIAPILEAANYYKEQKQIFRNQLYTKFFIMDYKIYDKSSDKEMFFELSYIDPLKNQKVNIKLSKKDFMEIKEGSDLSKMCAHYKIKHIEEHQVKMNAKQLSIKYQVLCKSTAIIGVIKQKNKAEQVQELKSARVNLKELAEQKLYLEQQAAYRYQSNLIYGGSRGGRGGSSLVRARAATKCKAPAPSGMMMKKKMSKEQSRDRSRSRSRDRDRDSHRNMLENLNFAQNTLGAARMFIDEQAEQEDEEDQDDDNLNMYSSAMNNVGSTKIQYSSVDDFQKIIMAQNVDGSWKDMAIITGIIAGFNAKDFKTKIENAINQFKLGKLNVEIAWVTIAILLILVERFKGKQSEWQLIAKKAKKYLQNQGITKPDTLLANIKLK